MSFLSDFIQLGEGTECPDRFLIWSGLSLLGAVAGPKLVTGHGTQFTVDTKLYVTLVGTPGSGKSVAMEKSEDIFLRYFPTYLISESIQSREDILSKMSSAECIKAYKLPDGRLEEYRPFYCIVDEMENFVSVGNSKSEGNKMIAMLVGIYSRKSFGTGFKTDVNKAQRIKNPYLSLLACTVPEWMMSSLRISLFTGGLGRRLIIVHCRKDKMNPFPNKPTNYNEIETRVVSHLKQIEQASGFLVWTPDAKKWWADWYINPSRKNKADPILIQFHENLHMQLLKIATALALSEKSIKLVIDTPHFEAGYKLLSDLDEDIVRLTSGIGRNELAGVSTQLIDFIERTGGTQTEINILKYFRRYVREPEFMEIVNSLTRTGELFVERRKRRSDGVERTFYFTPSGRAEFERMEKDGGK